MRSGFLLTAALPLAAAYPWAMEASRNMEATVKTKRQDGATVRQPNFLTNRPNTGSTGPPAPFDASAQFVDVGPGSGHEFRAPRKSDRRGLCPGLNAAANHGFMPRNGIPNIVDTVTGLRKAYNMFEDLSLFLAVVSVAFAGDIVTTRWSIGGEFPSTLPILLSPPSGLLGTHNKYENDASPVRGDAYMNDGNVGVFQMRSWEYLYGLAEEYTMDTLAAHNEYTTQWSIQNNPYYFAGPFSGVVSPAAHNFIVNFMSNHSAEAPGGTLTRDVLKSFFSVEGEPGSFIHNLGMERIPTNWYKRPAANSYGIVSAVLDVQINNGMYPGIFAIGGNTGTVNSFTGVNFADLTGGVFNATTLFEGNNLACFVLQTTSAVMPSQLQGLVSDVGEVLGFVLDQLGPIGDKLSCPQLAPFDNGLFTPFPGAAGYFN